MNEQKHRPVLDVGKTVKPYGKIAAIMLTGGERYYFLIDKHGVVSMIPALVIEAGGMNARRMEPTREKLNQRLTEWKSLLQEAAYWRGGDQQYLTALRRLVDQGQTVAVLESALATERERAGRLRNVAQQAVGYLKEIGYENTANILSKAIVETGEVKGG